MIGSSTANMKDGSFFVSAVMRLNLFGPTGWQVHRRPDRPVSCINSHSEMVAQHSPIDPDSICRLPMSALRWTFTCERRLMPVRLQ